VLTGHYRIRFVPASGYLFTLPNQGDDEMTDSDVVTLDGFTPVINLLPGQVEPAIDAGLLPLDFGDLPNEDTAVNSPTYATTIADDGPRHRRVQGLRIGRVNDSEVDGQPNATSSGDDIILPGALDDEDGVILPVFKAEESANVTVRVFNRTGTVAMLYGFIDMNGDGDFVDTNEAIKRTVPNDNDGDVILTFSVPSNAESALRVGARFRLSTAENLGPDGVAPDGEVEDYLIEITPPTLIELETNESVALVEMTGSPGVTTSGLMRPSAVGPRLENAETSFVTEPVPPGAERSDWL